MHKYICRPARIHRTMLTMHKRTISEVLSYLMSQRGIGPTELARATGVDQTTVSRIKSGGIKVPKDDKVYPLAKFFGVSVEQLRGRVPLGAMASQGGQSFTSGNAALQNGTVESVEIASNVTEGPPITVMVPILSWVQAGSFCEAIDMIQPGDAEDWTPSPGPCSKHAYSLKVRGRSMEPEFREGEIVIVDPEVHADPGCYVIARRTNQNDCTFKRLAQDGGEFYLEAVNTEWPEPIIRLNED